MAMSIERWIKDTVLELDDDDLWLWWIATGLENEMKNNNLYGFEYHLFDLIFNILEYGAIPVIFENGKEINIMINNSKKETAIEITKKWISEGDDSNGNGIWFIKK